MMKNDIGYEYRVFTNRIFDIESMEVGICTSKNIKEMKSKDKVDGRFFHTSDSDEWYFCWNGELQRLNLKGDSDVNAALAEVKKLISDANIAVSEANKVAKEAKEAAADAKSAADAANDAVENIGDKADKSDVEAVSKMVEAKADSSVVEALSDKVNAIKVPSLEGYATELFVKDEISKIDIPEVPTKVSAFENDANYLTEHQDISGKQDVIKDLDDIRTNAALGASALQDIPEEYITESDLSDKGYLTNDSLNDYATKEFVGGEIEKIDIPEVPTKVSAFENDANYLTEHQSLENYYTKAEVNKMIEDINALIGEAINITNTILA